MSSGPVARTGAETGVPVPADTVAQGATNPPKPPESAISSGNDGSGYLRAALGRVIAEGDYSPGAMWSVPGIGDAERIVEVVLAAGYRLVVDDDTTVERVARAMNDAAAPVDPTKRGPARYEALALAAVRALREEQ